MSGFFDELVAAAVAREAADDARFVLPRRPDPFVLAAAVAVRTTRIRLVVVVDTAEVHPYVIARRLAALDKISAGRAEWLPRDDDPDRRTESVGLVEALLGSWKPGAVRNDKQAGIHVDVSRIEPVHHDGLHWSVHSPLDVPAGPQGVVPRAVSV
ncbi:xenobiotic compound monooxygenase, DszA family, A subunit [Pseudonocardia sp. Ae717_Ps2]|uniref:LLM class flavin-dependent oxidoreductase n=1 Tax=unclassified Pseudonocardia TaxID=2619320 RepID=UPI00094AE6C1|nr:MULTISPECIES: LLM class flavin-dependent oxidoreductase [unclassified Pseudonocardia]OLM14069.1 xenobiotic compound monooxygenase, DszA family, A subunit [Pseudonocardia sp. Ae505_Ps2]OLM31249.1 xenobiotic compound monooxygenase, DszA family, A subunit [Pseudonocardia sp. Ae717_Ps2]